MSKEMSLETKIDVMCMIIDRKDFEKEVKQRLRSVKHYLSSNVDFISGDSKTEGVIYFHNMISFNTKNLSKIKRLWKREGVKLNNLYFSVDKETNKMKCTASIKLL